MNNLHARFHAAISANPSLGFASSGASIAAGVWAWLLAHLGDITAFLGLLSVIVGLVAGWYTIRVQRATLEQIKRQMDDKESGHGSQ